MKHIRIKAIAVILLTLTLASLLFACQGQTPQPPPPDSGAAGSATSPGATDPTDRPYRRATPQVPEMPELIEVESIIILLDAETFARGTNVTPEVIILPEDAADKRFELTSSDNRVLRRRSGRWAAVGEGTAELVATAPNGVTGTATVVVYVAVDSISIDVDEITIHRGESATILPEILPEDATDREIIFTSENEGVAGVSEDGTIIAHNQGTTTINVSVGGIEETVTVIVIEPVSSITISTDRRSYQVGDQGRFFIRITPDGASDAALTVGVSGDEISLTGENTFLAVAPGEATITVTAANGVAGTLTITVVNLESFSEDVFRLTNLERERANISPFYRTQALEDTAMVRANEIIEYFSHTRPDGRDAFTAFAENNVDYLTAGENLAAGHRTPEDVVRGWMASPGHRANILNGAFGRMGVGVVMDENGRLYWTQTFTD
ncbi:MAG: Ig-like domain-containing protein [Oscillospiraceae bacterium]|nr:Ig-like domain-containing protein [Oscillospiraceae bacterium]